MKYQSIKLLKYNYVFIFLLGILFIAAQFQNNPPIDINFNSNGFILKGKFYPANGEGSFQTVLLMQGFPGNEIDRRQTRQFVTLLRRLAIDANAAVVLISHPSLTGIASGSGLSGNTAWHNSTRARLSHNARQRR